jgi:hypothetical protein
MDRQIGEINNRWTDTDRRMDGWAYRQMKDGRMDIHRQMDGQTEGWTDRRMDRQRDEQTEG